MSEKIGIAPRVLPHTSLNALNPKLVPFSLFSLSVPIGILPRFLDASNGNAKAIFGPSLEAFGVF